MQQFRIPIGGKTSLQYLACLDVSNIGWSKLAAAVLRDIPCAAVLGELDVVLVSGFDSGFSGSVMTYCNLIISAAMDAGYRRCPAEVAFALRLATISFLGRPPAINVPREFAWTVVTEPMIDPEGDQVLLKLYTSNERSHQLRVVQANPDNGFFLSDKLVFLPPVQQ